MNIEKEKHKMTCLIVVPVLIFCLLTAAITTFDVLKMLKPAETEVAVEPPDTAVFKEIETFDTAASDDESEIELKPVVDDPVISNPEEEGYDYNVDSTDSFDTEYLIDASETAEELPFSMEVSWKNLASEDTCKALYSNIQKDETFDEAAQTEYLDKLGAAMLTLQEDLKSVDGTTTSLEYDFYTNSEELMLEVRVRDEEDNVIYTNQYALDVLSNEGDANES